jgi:aryl-alcohol dehydrogenase-like predicted oxidoreductase
MPDVEYRPLGRSGLKVSRLCLGAMNFGNTDFGCDEATSIEIINAFLDRGHNFIDTGNVYSIGISETIVGKAIKDRRHQVVLATKAGGQMAMGPHDVGTGRKHLIKACDDSLRRLDTDYIDLYQMHRYDTSVPLEETLSTLNDLVRAGKVRYVGVSNWSASQIAEAARIIEARGWEPMISLQPQYSIIARDIEVEIVGVCQRFGLGVIPWSPLAGGLLTGKYKRDEEPATGTRFGGTGPMMDIWKRRLHGDRNYEIVDVVVAEAEQLGVTPIALSLAWNLAQPGIVAPIIGPKSVAQLEGNFAALDVTVPEESMDRINQVSRPHLPYPQNFYVQLRPAFQPARS